MGSTSGTSLCGSGDGTGNDCPGDGGTVEGVSGAGTDGYGERRHDAEAMDQVSDDKRMRGVIEEHVKRNCNVLTLAQRCADWFLLSKYHIRATFFGNAIMK
mmetsp:Transcript_154/g.336  ORF Transcript_154/g.336 Transcript_154/m.336 type:complete len:101 (-) Transcript_154:461-763(-)